MRRTGFGWLRIGFSGGLLKTPSGSIKKVGFFDKLSNYQIFI
jgi:hypothetical protein